MNAFEIAARKYALCEEDQLGDQIIALAYLQLHRSLPGLHPDDRMEPENGYCGWHMLLADKAFKKFATAPDAFRYPYWVDAPLNFALDSIVEFHQADDDYHFYNLVSRLVSWLDDMDTENLEHVDRDLSELIQFHEGAPEDVWNPLKDASEIFHWILNLDTDN